MPSWVLLAATKKLADLADSLSGNAMCHDLALATPEAMSKAAPTAVQNNYPESLFQNAEETQHPQGLGAVDLQNREPASPSAEPSHAMKQKAGQVCLCSFHTLQTESGS